MVSSHVDEHLILEVLEHVIDHYQGFVDGVMVYEQLYVTGGGGREGGREGGRDILVGVINL